jgi:hypothetical protein
MGVGGGILTTAGLGLSLRNFEGIFDPANPPKNETLEGFLWITGAGLLITSIPFYISASKNRIKLLSYCWKTALLQKLSMTTLLIPPCHHLLLKLDCKNHNYTFDTRLEGKNSAKIFFS